MNLQSIGVEQLDVTEMMDVDGGLDPFTVGVIIGVGLGLVIGAAIAMSVS